MTKVWNEVDTVAITKPLQPSLQAQRSCASPPVSIGKIGLAVATGVLLAFLAGSCARGPNGPNTAATAGSTQTPDYTSSALADHLGFDLVEEDFDDRIRDKEALAEDRVAECMAGLGFEYQPRTTTMTLPNRPSADVDFFSPEWIATYGFGISTLEFEQSRVGSDLAGHEEHAASPESLIAIPPGMSASEQRSYQTALFGDQATKTDEPTGCQAQSYSEVFSTDETTARHFRFEFRDELALLEERIRSDSRVVSYHDEVARCVAINGSEWPGETVFRDEMKARLAELRDPPAGDPFVAAGLDASQMSSIEIDEFLDGLTRLTGPQLDELSKLQAEEIALAHLVERCNGGPKNEQSALAEIRREYELSFIREHETQLKRYVEE